MRQARSVSVVIPVYNEEGNVAELHEQLTCALSCCGLPYEIIFVDDASTDRTAVLLGKLRDRDKKIKLVELTENRGQSFAFLSGFRIATGDVIVTMDADLQNDPSDIALLLSRINEGFDFVNGWRQRRQDRFFRKALSSLANILIASRTRVRLRDYGCALTASRKDLIRNLLSCGNRSRFIKPMLSVLAGSVSEVAVAHRKRKRGSSKYGLLKIARSGTDFLLNFRPHENKRTKQ